MNGDEVEQSDLFKGRRALVTGSTSGIGLAIARRLMRGGADVVLNYRNNESNASSVTKELSASGRGRCIAKKADMANADDCLNLATEAIEFLGGLDFLIHNAGPFEMGTVAEMPIEKNKYIMDANYTSAFILTQACIGELRKSDYPSIVYIGGVNSGTIKSGTGMSAYASAKAALAVLMRTVAVEEGPKGIRANMVCPGFIDTGSYGDAFKENSIGKIPLGRFGEPDDVAAPVCWLLTKEAGYVSGAIIDAGGGLWM